MLGISGEDLEVFATNHTDHTRAALWAAVVIIVLLIAALPCARRTRPASAAAAVVLAVAIGLALLVPAYLEGLDIKAY